MIISIIAAMAKNGLIGNGNALPWHLPADMAHFKELTVSKPVLMGENTYLSIGKPLEDRINIVLSNNPAFIADGCLVARSIDEAISLAEKSGAGELMVIGGASVYRQFLPIADRIYLTVIDGDFKGNVFFPEYDKNNWQEILRQEHRPDDNNPYSYAFITLKKIK